MEVARPASPRWRTSSVRLHVVCGAAAERWALGSIQEVVMSSDHTRLLGLVVLLQSACAPAVTPRDSAADMAAINAIYVAGPASLVSEDVSAYLTVLDDSIAILLPSAPPIRGKATVRTVLEGMFATGSYSATLSERRVGIADSLAYAEYTGVFVTRPDKGDSVVGHLRYVDVLRRQKDGSWRLFLHSAHPDEPVVARVGEQPGVTRQP
jgi:ketosteroid isomerase-like protein